MQHYLYFKKAALKAAFFIFGLFLSSSAEVVKGQSTERQRVLRLTLAPERTLLYS